MKRRAIDFFCTFLYYLVIFGLPAVCSNFIYSLVTASFVDWQILLSLAALIAFVATYGYEDGIKKGYKDGHHEGYQIGCEIERNVQLQSSKTT